MYKIFIANLPNSFCVGDILSRVKIEGLKESVAICHRVIAWAEAAAPWNLYHGHVSGRIPGTKHFICKGRGYEDIGKVDSIDLMNTEDMVVYDLDCKIVESLPELRPVGEIKLHAEVLKAMPEVGGVVHMHTPYANLCAILNKPIFPMTFEHLELWEKPIPIVDLFPRLISSEEDAKEAAKVLKESGAKAMLHRYHGAVVIGESAIQATMLTIILEQNAKLNIIAAQATGTLDHPHIPDKWIKDFMSWYHEYDAKKRPSPQLSWKATAYQGTKRRATRDQCGLL